MRLYNIASRVVAGAFASVPQPTGKQSRKQELTSGSGDPIRVHVLLWSIRRP